MRLHAETTGAGPALVLVHGWGLHSGIWTPLLPALARRFEVTCVDLPGHGLSPAATTPLDLEAMAEAVAAVAPPGAAWLGWSLGGQVALAAALAGRMTGPLVLVATTPCFVAARDWPCGVAPEVLDGFARSLAADHAKALRDFLALQLRGDRRAAALLRLLRAALAERPAPDAAALRDGLAILAGTDLRDRLGGIDQPALVIAGARDRLTPADAGRRLAAALPGARCVVLPDAAHAPFLAAPGAFTADLADFLGPLAGAA